MNARQKKLLKILINEEDYISVDQLMDQLAVSKRTVHNDLCKVEDFLSDYHIELKRKSKQNNHFFTTKYEQSILITPEI